MTNFFCPLLRSGSFLLRARIGYVNAADKADSVYHDLVRGWMSLITLYNILYAAESYDIYEWISMYWAFLLSHISFTAICAALVSMAIKRWNLYMAVLIYTWYEMLRSLLRRLSSKLSCVQSMYSVTYARARLYKVYRAFYNQCHKQIQMIHLFTLWFKEYDVYTQCWLHLLRLSWEKIR